MARKILLADDSVTAQNMGRKILTEAGYEVTTVNNGSAALKKINELKPDLIVLDVYMPGYGGLEVCHRLKENPETARIPVLLTVGKLEPFKVEEARRVRADMHIVKPFESNELLTALAKLEDRIVAQSDAPKKGRFSKTGLAEPAPADTFGDEQSGWKSRLIAPKKKAKPEKAEKIEPKPEPKREREYTTEEGAEAETVSATDWRSMLSASLAADANTEDEPQPTAKAEAKSNAGLKAEAKQEVPEEIQQETKPVTDSLAAEVLRNAQAAVAAETTQPEVQVPVAETKNQAEKIKAEEIREEEKIEEKEAGDQDVADALATLVPAPSSTDERELVGVASHQIAGASGPRWTAQEMLVNEEESQSLLEQEMERAYAQFTATAETTPAVSFAMGPLDAMSFSSASDEPVSREQQYRERRRAEECAAESKNEFSEVQAAQSEVAEEAAKVEEAPTEAVAQETYSPAAPDPVEEKGEAPAETKEETKETAKEEVKEESVEETRRVSSAASLWMSAPAAYVAATTESKPEPQTESTKAEAPAAQEAVNQDAVAPPAAFAAAAGAEVTSASTAETTAEPAQSPSAKKESELAAAWQSWRQIREVDGKSSAAASEPEKPAKFKDVANWRDEIEPAAKAESKDKDDEESHGEEISSLVDTMLAELKPKLMKEIAKKMGKDKDSKR